VSPILLRPVREQLQHDRVIQALLARWRRRYEVAVNIGADQSTTVKAAGTLVSPDLVLWSAKGARRLEGIAEVETAESVNHLEAMAQWATFGRVRARFYLYVPAGAADVAQRLCLAHDIKYGEIWTYHAVGDALRFTMVHRRPPGRSGTSRAARKAAGARATARARTPKLAAPRKPSAKTASRKKAGRSTSTRASQSRARTGAATKKGASRTAVAGSRGTKTAARSTRTIVKTKKRAPAGRRPSRSTRASRRK
jgi:hypothetical protein